MKKRLASIFTFAAYFLWHGPAARAAGIAGKGGGSVVCQYYVTQLDEYGVENKIWFTYEFMTDGFFTERSEVWAEYSYLSDWPQIKKRFLGLLTEKAPAWAASYREFLASFDGRRSIASRKWVAERSLPEITAVDPEVLEALPITCLEPKISQLIVREVDGDRIIYHYDSEKLDRFSENSSVEFSFLLVHEWLRDFTDDAESLRLANRFLHSSAIQSLSREQVEASLRAFLSKEAMRQL